ncbi:MAG: zinc-binding dehydrogenase [Thermoplasmata archaeon]
MRLQGLWSNRRRGRQVKFKASSPRTEDLVLIREFIEVGKIRSAIDRRYPLEQVPEAHRYVESGRARGKVVIAVVQNRHA